MALKLDVPNLDAETMDPAELDEFAKHVNRVAAYADIKAQGMRYRVAGKIVEAEACERRCQMIYELLPPSWRW